MLIGAIGQHDAEAVAADAADDVAHPEAAVETLAHRDDHRIGGLVAERVVDRGELVDADGEIRTDAARAQARGDDVIERLAQPLLVEVAGELVVIGGVLEAQLLRLTAGDEAPDAVHAHRPAGLVEHGRAAVMHPGEAAILGADAELAVEDGAARPVGVEALLAQQQVVRVEAAGQRAPGADGAGVGDAEHGRDRAVPGDGVGGEIPIIGDIAGSGESSLQAMRHVFLVRGHNSAAH